MEEVQKILPYKGKIERGGKEVRVLAAELRKERSVEESEKLAHTLYSEDEVAVRMVAVYLLGILASQSKSALPFLRETVGTDKDWRVQEILAQALDRYCVDTGYGQNLELLESWLHDAQANVRRAAAEGPRIWTTRDYFKDHPEAAIRLLAPLRGDESEYVRKSVGNALRDISRKHKSLIAEELSKWDTTNKKVSFTYKLASKFLE